MFFFNRNKENETQIKINTLTKKISYDLVFKFQLQTIVLFFVYKI